MGKNEEEVFAITEQPPDGAYIYGQYLEGCRWDRNVHLLADSEPKTLFTQFPLMVIIPESNRVKPKSGFYDCPCYRVLTRIGQLSTTGHSTNFVMNMEIPSDQPQDTWIRAGVALFLAL